MILINIKQKENILITIGIAMCLVLFGYNIIDFFGKDSNIKISGDIISQENYNNTQKEENINENFVNINSASEEELTSLKHIGPAIALRIIEYRETHGGFMNIDEIKNVRGIGQAVFEDIKNYICV
ncbi:MAG: helix-hairpin-helix domain-containing protein [Clostridia bacterium]|nr:helix-hairpin-helix domain-containing protein [Clostridia bacterium]